MKRFDTNPQDAAIECAERSLGRLPRGAVWDAFSDTCNKKHAGRRRA